MGKLYAFKRNKKTIRETIHSGHITEKIRGYLEESYQRHEALYPNDWDTLFIKQMLTWDGHLSRQQKELLMEILKYEIQEEEFPNGILDILFVSEECDKR